MVVGVFEILGGGFLAALFSYALFARGVPAMRAARGGTRVNGTILSVQRRPGRSREVQVLAIEFTAVGGQRVEFTRNAPNLAPVNPGDTVPVLYNPSNPKNSATLGDARAETRGAMIGGFVTLACLAVVVLGIVTVLK
jgi:hypothetical protein